MITWQQIEGSRGNHDKLVGELQALYGMTPDQAGEGVACIEQRLDQAGAGGERMYGAR